MNIMVYKGIRVNDIYQYMGSRSQCLIVIGISGRENDTRDIHTKIHYRYLRTQETHWAYYTHFSSNFTLLENK